MLFLKIYSYFNVLTIIYATLSNPYVFITDFTILFTSPTLAVIMKAFNLLVSDPSNKQTPQILHLLTVNFPSLQWLYHLTYHHHNSEILFNTLQFHTLFLMKSTYSVIQHNDLEHYINVLLGSYSMLEEVIPKQIWDTWVRLTLVRV